MCVFNIFEYIYGFTLSLVLILQVSDGPLPGLAFGFPDNETDLPQEAQTITTISWQPIPHTTEYEVSCNPITHLEERGFQVHTLTRADTRNLLEMEGLRVNVSPSSYRCVFLVPPTVPH